MQAKAAIKDGNKEYKDENFKRAIEHYERAVEHDPNFAEAWFYLGSSHQALYRPGKETPRTSSYLEKAIESYKKSLENNKADTENLKKVKVNTLGALTAIYSEDPVKDFTRRSDTRAARRGQPERPQEPVRAREPLREVRPGRRGGEDLQEGRRAERPTTPRPAA